MANLIAEIEAMGQQKKGENVALVVKLKESNGMSFDWTSWHINAFKDYSIGDVVEIVPELKQREDGKRPYRNIGSVVGKRTPADINMLDTASGQVSASKPSTSTSFNGGARYSTPEAQVYERRSIERQGSIGKVVALLEHFRLEELTVNIDAILEIAGKIEAHVQRDGGLVWPVGRGESGKSTAQSQSAPSNGRKPEASNESKSETTGAGRPNDGHIPKDVPELLTMASKLFRKNKHDVCMVFSVPDEEWADIADRAGSLEKAWESLVNLWSEPPK